MCIDDMTLRTAESAARRAQARKDYERLEAIIRHMQQLPAGTPLFAALNKLTAGLKAGDPQDGLLPAMEALGLNEGA